MTFIRQISNERGISNVKQPYSLQQRENPISYSHEKYETIPLRKPTAYFKTKTNILNMNQLHPFDYRLRSLDRHIKNGAKLNLFVNAQPSL